MFGEPVLAPKLGTKCALRRLITTAKEKVSSKLIRAWREDSVLNVFCSTREPEFRPQDARVTGT